jgi:acetyl esterase/lipase
MKQTLIFVISFFLFLSATGQEFIPLWPAGKKPNFNGAKVTDSISSERVWKVATPGIYSFTVPESENKGSAVLICPGGGYERLAYMTSGFNLAKWYNSIGVNAFVLIYRLPHQQDLQQRELAPLQDAQRAMKIIRSNAARWNIKANKIGVMGISAGGHLATTLGTHTVDEARIKDELDSVSVRPDFMILLSPVISMGPITHAISKKNILGPNPPATLVQQYSNELQVSSYTPPSFIVHALNDSVVKVQNSLLFYQALLDKKVNASLHIFPQGAHAIRIDDNPGSTDLWMELLEAWMKEMGWAEKKPFP